MTAESQRELWKNRLNRSTVRTLGEHIKAVYPRFEVDRFAAGVLTKEYFDLELKGRIKAIARQLLVYLPQNYAKAVDILIETAPRVGEFENWVLTDYVEQFGLDHFDESVEALKELTQFGTGEFAIRPYMIRYTERMLAVLHEWASHPNEHVRRLAAEASRPRGVWVAHIETFKHDPTPVLHLLGKLKADPSKYVRTAVANCLNDISKEHPDAVVETALSWKRDGNRETDWIIKRACRSIIKQGNRRVFPILGFAAEPEISVSELSMKPKRVRIGGVARFSFSITSTARKLQKLMIDYRIHYARANGRVGVKVFKLTEKTVGAGEGLPLVIKQRFQDLSTRRHYPGPHKIEIIVNGAPRAEIDFSLKR